MKEKVDLVLLPKDKRLYLKLCLNIFKESVFLDERFGLVKEYQMKCQICFKIARARNYISAHAHALILNMRK
jgi:hypothetical protein